MASASCVTLIDGLLATFSEDQRLKVATVKDSESPQAKQYKWDWNQKLDASPFRKEMKRLKEESKTKQSSKAYNKAARHRLRAQEKELLIDFQMKCDAAKIWINEAHENYHDANNTNDDNLKILKQIAIQRKAEKIHTIDQFWEELICYETVFVQNEKIKLQKQQMAELETKLSAHKAQLASIKKGKNSGISSKAFTDSQRDKFPADSTIDNKPKVSKKKKKKAKSNKEQYQGLFGYFNRPKKAKSGTQNVDKTVKKEKKQVTEEIKNGNNEDLGGFLSYQYVPKITEDDVQKLKETNTKKEEEEPIKNEVKPAKQAKNPKIKAEKGSMKGGFLKQGTNGLYDDKKQDSELSIDEKNIKNRKQIEEMGFADAVDKPFFSWERPKEEREANRKEMEKNAAKSTTNQ